MITAPPQPPRGPLSHKRPLRGLGGPKDPLADKVKINVCLGIQSHGNRSFMVVYFYTLSIKSLITAKLNLDDENLDVPNINLNISDNINFNSSCVSSLNIFVHL